MKQTIEIENDLALPLQNNNVEWNLYVYKKKYKKNILVSYEMYNISNIRLDTIYSDIHTYIIKNYLNKLEINNYSSEMPKNQIGFIDLTDKNNILKNSLELINSGMDNSVPFASQDLSLHGYILECRIDGQTYMKILSTSKPIRIYKHKYSLIFNNKFKEIEDPILTLNHTCDCILFSNYSLFFTGRAESIFDLEKHYKVLAAKCLSTLKDKQLFENFDNFSQYASSWPKATKFENFDAARINYFALLDVDIKKKILNNFAITSNENGAIITNSPEENEKVLNFICRKLLLDFNNDGYEVCYPKKITQ